MVSHGIRSQAAGQEAVFREEFIGAKVQRFQVNVAKNVFAKVSKQLQKTVADNMNFTLYPL